MNHADPKCPLCHGEGYVWDDPDDFMPISGRTCSCLLRNIELEERVIRLKSSELPDRYADATIEHFHLRGGVAAVENKDRVITESVSIADIDEKNAARVAELAATPLGSSNVIFTGPIGAGKTYLASALMVSQIRDHGKSGLYITFLDYVRRLLPDGESPDAQRTLRDKARNVNVLLIDDLGVEKTSAFALRELWGIVHARTTTNDRGILITSNYTLADALLFKDREAKGLSPDQIEAMELGKRIYSRLVESGVLPITWPAGTKDFRYERSPAVGGERKSPTYGDLRDRQRAGRMADVIGSTFDEADLAAAAAQVQATPGVSAAVPAPGEAPALSGEDPFGESLPARSGAQAKTPTMTPASSTERRPVARGAGKEAPPEGSSPLTPAGDEDF